MNGKLYFFTLWKRMNEKEKGKKFKRNEQEHENRKKLKGREKK
jgi:hypothetical protein